MIRTPLMTCRWRHALALFLALLLPIGAAQAAGKALGRDDDAKINQHAGPEREGGIDPTTVPILDEDLEFCVEGSPVVLLGEAARQQLQVDAAHEHATGLGVVVAVLDGGFDLTHPAVATRWLCTGYDAVDDDSDAHGQGLDDDGLPGAACGHGTFVAAMVAGVAPDAWLIPVRVRDDEGWGTNAELVRGLEYAWSMGADVVNLSVSAATVQNAGLVRTIRAMRHAGVAFVVSLGNESDASQNNLAGMIDTIAVGAVDEFDHIAPFSNFNLYAFRNAPVVYAPGVDLYGPLCIGGEAAYGWWSGTSFAAAIVSGAAALGLEAHPALAPLDLYDLLATSVDPAWGPAGEDLDGLGRIDLRKVVAP